MSVARARLLEPLYKVDVPLTHAALVIGGGVAGMTAAARARRDGPRGAPRRARPEARRPRPRARPHDPRRRPGRARRRARAAAHRQPERARSTSRAELADFHGFIGNFSSVVRAGGRQARRTGRPRRRHRRDRLAGGAPRALRPRRRAPKVVTGMDLERMLKDDDPALDAAGAVGFVLCAGSLDENKPYCSRTCCQQSIKNAIALKETRPRASRLRVVQGGPHLRPPRGVLHEGARAGRRSSRATTSASKPAVSANGQVEVAYRDPYLAPRHDAAARPARAGHAGRAGRRRRGALQAPQGAAHRRRLLPRGARQAAPRRLRQRGHLPLRRGALPEEHRRDDQPGLRRRRTGRGHPGQAGPQSRRRRRRGRPGQVRRLPHLRARLPLRGADHRGRHQEGQDRGGRLPGLRHLRQRVPGQGDHPAPLHRRRRSSPRKRRSSWR